MLKSSRPSPLLSPTIVVANPPEEPRSKVPLRQIASFVERLQKQNGQAETELDRVKAKNKDLETKVKDLEAKIQDLELNKKNTEDIEKQLKESLFSSAQFFELTKERDGLLEQIESLNNESNFLPILQHELQCLEEEKKALRDELDSARQESTVYRTTISNMENSNIAVEVRIDAQMREIAKLTRDNRSLTKENHDLLESIKKVSQTKRAEMTTEDIEQWIRMAKASGKAERVPSLIQMDKLKKENRSLLTDKIKLESEVWALSPNKDADSKMTLLEQKVAELQSFLSETQSELIQKNESIDNLVIERNELREIKTSLNAQVYTKSACIEATKERLSRLSCVVRGDLDSIGDVVELGVRHAPSFIGSSAECQTDDQECEILPKETEDNYLEKISELEAEVRALSLYVTKMVSRVASNHQLQSALFFGSSANIPISNGSGSAETESLKEVAQKVTTHHPALQPAPQSEEYSTDPEDINIGKTQSWIM